jgi:hypothetical protein
MLAWVAILAVSAQAAGPIHTNFSFTIPDDSVCGIPVMTSGIGVDNFTPIFDSDGNLVRVFDMGEFHITYTALNGKSVQVSAAGPRIANLTVNSDGTMTFTTTYEGLPERISTTRGAILTRDAGIVTFITTVDSDGNVISQTVTQSGPHPEADADFALFCEVVTVALA